MSVFGLPYLTFVIVNLFFKKATQNTSCIWGGSPAWHTGAWDFSEHLWETISHSWGSYWGTWLEHKPSHVNTDFHRGKYSSWAVRTYFRSASETEFPQCWGRGLSISWWSHCSGCNRGQEEWLNCCVHQQPFQLTLIRFLVSFDSLVWQDRPVKYLLLMLAFCLLLGLLFLGTETGGSGTWSWK